MGRFYFNTQSGRLIGTAQLTTESPFGPAQAGSTTEKNGETDWRLTSLVGRPGAKENQRKPSLFLWIPLCLCGENAFSTVVPSSAAPGSFDCVRLAPHFAQ